MASASILALNPQQHTGAYSTPPLDRATAAKATELLQQNHDRFHMYFNSSGFHNHIAHHMLALYAFNAPPDVLKRHYDENSDYQRALKPVDPAALEDLEEPSKFKKFLFQRDHYHDYLALFEREIDKLGVKQTLARYLFAEDERAKDMLNRLYAGILHPIIHLGYGIEWEQPAITAEALAMTATHDSWTAALFDAVEPLLAQHASSTRTLYSLMLEAAQDPAIVASPRYDDDLRVRDGVLGRAGAKMAALVAQWSVTEANLDCKLAELANFTCAMVVGGQRADQPFRIDFTLMHCANAVPLVAALVDSSYVPDPMRVKLVQRLGQYALMTFVAQGSPKMRFDLMREHHAKSPETEWSRIVQRVFQVPDDGHAVKLIRALRFADSLSARLDDGNPELRILNADDCLKAGTMVVEIMERRDNYAHVRGSGFDQAWQS